MKSTTLVHSVARLLWPVAITAGLVSISHAAESVPNSPKNLDYLEEVHVFKRSSNQGYPALSEARQAPGSYYPSVGLSDKLAVNFASFATLQPGSCKSLIAMPAVERGILGRTPPKGQSQKALTTANTAWLSPKAVRIGTGKK